MIKLGSKVQDELTGFAGIATARTDWLYGCIRYAVESQKLKDGKPVEVQWFDEQRLKVIKPKISKKAKIGGPQKDPTYF